MKNSETISAKPDFVDFDERIIQCDKEIAALQIEKEKILKEKEQKRVFYIGEKFTCGTTVYMLIQEQEKDVARLLTVDSSLRENIGKAYKNPKTVDVYYSKGIAFTKQLPTEYPEDFGLGKEYGI